MTVDTYAWADALEARAPDIVAAWRGHLDQLRDVAGMAR
jgi:hypothetical protein